MRTTIARRLGLALVAVCGAAASQTAVQPLRLCADPQNLPFSSNAPDAVAKDMPGLYVEIARAVAEALGRPLQVHWSLSYYEKRNLRTTLLANQCDMVVGLPATPDFMGPRLIFSRPILKPGYALVVPREQGVAGIDDLKGKRVAVQFASPPQSLLATRSDVTLVTVLDPETAMRRLAAGEADAAFIWGPSAGYIDHTELSDKFKVIPVEGPQMQYPAAIGFAANQKTLRDEVDSTLERLAPKIESLSRKYSFATGPAVALAGSAATQPQARQPETSSQDSAKAGAGNVAAGSTIFNSNCAHCHGPDAIVADRKIDLRRLERKYEDEMDKVFFTTVTEGRPSKGMPAWKDVYSHQDFVNILAYLKTLQNK